jgi:hypothetical protein
MKIVFLKSGYIPDTPVILLAVDNLPGSRSSKFRWMSCNWCIPEMRRLFS